MHLQGQRRLLLHKAADFESELLKRAVDRRDLDAMRVCDLGFRVQGLGTEETSMRCRFVV